MKSYPNKFPTRPKEPQLFRGRYFFFPYHGGPKSNDGFFQYRLEQTLTGDVDSDFLVSTHFPSPIPVVIPDWKSIIVH